MSLYLSMEYSDDLDRLVADSALAAIDPDAPLIQIETALRSLVPTMAKADPLRRAMVREATIRRLKSAGVHSPAILVDTAFGGAASPNLDSTIQLRAATPWPEPVHGPVLLDEMVATLKRFVVLPAGAGEVQALWCLYTYASDAFGVSPILCIRSPEKRCGKTRNLEVLSCLVQRPLPTANITVAALYRTIDRYQPTLLIDEGDMIFVNGSNNELRGVLNAGLYRSNAFVLRCSGKHQEPKLSSVWCPKGIALIGRLPSTLEDRSIVMSLERRSAGETVEPFRYDRMLEGMDTLRRKAARWAADHLHELRSALPVVPEVLNDRARDLWRPLQAIADAAADAWPERARSAARELSSAAAEYDSPHTIRSSFQKQQTNKEVIPVKTEETIPAASDTTKIKVPRRVSAAKKINRPTTSKDIATKRRAAPRKTAPARKKATHSAAGRERAHKDTKKAMVLELLRRKQGAATAEIAKATGWQHHTIRGFISGNVTKRLGLAVESFKNEAGERIYKIVQ